MRFLKFMGRVLSGFLLLCLALSACHPKTRILKSPPHYNFATVVTYKLEDLELKEISGLAWDFKDNLFIANTDEAGKLFFLDKDLKVIIKPSFGDNGDYEDVAILNGIVYILRSDGMITRFTRDSSGKVLATEAGKISLSGTNDFEAMYCDPARKALVIICKNCKTDDNKSVSAFAFYPDSIGFDNKPLFTINAGSVEQLAPRKTEKLQPSAAAIHPVLQKLFILSSASHQLVIADLNGKVESVFELSRKLFPQPEGLAFKQNGDMFIANESITSRATILKFVYKDITDPKAAGSGYDFSKPDEKMELRKQLHEISGMAYIPAKGVILTENDEKGDIFMVDFKNKNDDFGKVKFGGKGDYEDIVHTDTAEYMLVSTGSVVEVHTKDSSFTTQEYTLDIKGTNEFEAMYMDTDGKSIILLCKQCAHEKDDLRSAYRFTPSTNSFAAEPVFTINVDSIRTILNDEKAEFKPSAAGINPVTGKLFVVASVGKLLVIADKKGKVEQVFRLDPILFNQPEGLTFAPDGDLYISNEGGEGVATILKFDYKKK